MTTHEESLSSAPTQRPRYNFITLLKPGDSSLPSQRKAVRSHAASYQRPHQEKASVPQVSRKRRHRNPRYVVYTVETDGTAIPPEISTYQQITQCFIPTPQPRVIGQGRVDPFRSYPVPWEPFIPEMVDHCLYIPFRPSLGFHSSILTDSTRSGQHGCRPART